MADDLVTCPYNIAHTIQRRRFDNHLMKCSRSYPHIKLDTCVFNTTHRIKPELMNQHLLVCPDKAHYDAEALENVVKECSMTRATVVDNTPAEEEVDEEDWGASCNNTAGGYNPAATIKNRNVIRKIHNATPSERKAFREEEIRRLRAIRSKTGDEENLNENGSDVSSAVNQRYIPGLCVKK